MQFTIHCHPNLMALLSPVLIYDYYQFKRIFLTIVIAAIETLEGLNLSIFINTIGSKLNFTHATGFNLLPHSF